MVNWTYKFDKHSSNWEQSVQCDLQRIHFSAKHSGLKNRQILVTLQAYQTYILYILYCTLYTLFWELLKAKMYHANKNW